MIRFYKTDKWSFSEHENIPYSDEEWEQWSLDYYGYFQTISEKLSKGFVKYYFSNHGFHDFLIPSIQIMNSKPSRTKVEVTLENGFQHFLLTYYSVSSYHIVVPEGKHWFFGNMQWLYDEFHLLDDGQWSHRIMCDGNCELNLVFKRVGIKKMEQQRR